MATIRTHEVLICRKCGELISRGAMREFEEGRQYFKSAVPCRECREKEDEPCN